MRKYRTGVLVESRYPGVIIGAVPSSDGMLLVDMPLRPDDGRDWFGQLTNTGRPKYLALMDQHLDRALGMRSFDLPIVGHDETLQGDARLAGRIQRLGKTDRSRSGYAQTRDGHAQSYPLHCI